MPLSRSMFQRPNDDTTGRSKFTHDPSELQMHTRTVDLIRHSALEPRRDGGLSPLPFCSPLVRDLTTSGLLPLTRSPKKLTDSFCTRIMLENVFHTY